MLLLTTPFFSVCLWAGCAGHPPPTSGTAQAADPYVGAHACAACHAEIFRRQEASPHALTFRAVPADWASNRLQPDLRVRDPETGLDYGVAQRGGKVWQVAYRSGRESGAAPFVYLLGSGHHGVSPLTRDGDRWRYLRLTYYAHHGWDRSPMHGRENSTEDDTNVHGWPLSNDDLAQCLRCHTTRLELSETGLDETRSEFGVRCESCHGPGRAHVEAMRAKSAAKAIENPGRWSSGSFMALCQQCHSGMSSFEGVQRGTDDDPASPALVLNQVHGITESRCFKKSGGALRCTTCHDPHSQATETRSFYLERCASCHAPGAAGKRACPVQPRGDCLPCHMPRVEVAPYTQFADHWIRARSPFVTRTRK